jgi:hypothetical protein
MILTVAAVTLLGVYGSGLVSKARPFCLLFFLAPTGTGLPEVRVQFG